MSLFSYEEPGWVDEIQDEIFEWEERVKKRALELDPEMSAKAARVDAYYAESDVIGKEMRAWQLKTQRDHLIDAVGRWVEHAHRVDELNATILAENMLAGSPLLADAERIDREKSEGWE